MKDQLTPEEIFLKKLANLADKQNSGLLTDHAPLINSAKNLSLSNLDKWERTLRGELFPYYISKSYYGPSVTKENAWIYLCSGNGYEREKALWAIEGAAPNAFFLAIALRRINDWVAEVRLAAVAKLESILEQSFAKDVVEVVSVLLTHWNSWKRMDESGRDLILRCLSRKEIADLLMHKILSSPSGPLSLLMSQVGRSSALDVHLYKLAFHAVQPSVRAKAFRSLFERKMRWVETRKRVWIDIRYCKSRTLPVIGERELSVSSNYTELLNGAANDSSSIVRRIAAEMLIRDLKDVNPTYAAQLAGRFVADQSPAVSERGVFALKLLEQMDTQIKL